MFRRPGVIERVYGPVSESLLELGRISPPDAFQKLNPNVSVEQVEQVSRRLIQELDDTDIAALRDEPEVRELLNFLGELQRDGVLMAAAAVP